MKYKPVFHRCYAVLIALWVAWCLCWPFYARKLDLRAASEEARETYKVCLQQQGVSQQDCLKDRDFNLRFQRKLIAPGGESPYRSFVGGSALVIAATMLGLCVIPPLLLYPILRGIVAVCAWVVAHPSRASQ